MKMNLQFFGGRGSSSGLGGGRMTIAGFLKNFRNASESDLGKLGLKVGKAQFTENGNSINILNYVWDKHIVPQLG